MIYSIHGFTGSSLVFEGLDSRPLVVMGHGKDAIAHARVSFDDEVDRLAAQLPEDAVPIVGYSMGARLALSLALRHPGRVSELSLISGSPGLASEEEREQRCQADAQWIRLLRDEGIEPFVDAWQEMPLWHTQASLPAELIARQRSARLAHDAKQLAYALESLGTGAMPNLWPRLEALELPVRIIVGALDRKFCDLGAKMAELIPRAKLVAIEDCGHNPTLEQPDALAALLREPLP